MYYVYKWTDPRKNEPIYIGKGQNDRYKSMTSRNKILRDKIKKIESEGFSVIKEKILEHLSEGDALLKEMELIAEIGRYDLGSGPLLNLTNGGDGLTSNDATYYANKRVAAGTHNFIGLNETRIAAGTHNFIGPDANNARISKGTHNLVNNNPHIARKGWKWMSNPKTKESMRVDPQTVDQLSNDGWLLGNYNNPQKTGNWRSSAVTDDTVAHLINIQNREV